MWTRSPHGEESVDPADETVDRRSDVVRGRSDQPPVAVLEQFTPSQVLPERHRVGPVQIALVLDRDAGVRVREVDACHPPPVHDDVMVQRRLWKPRPGQHEARPCLAGGAGAGPDLSDRCAELHDAAAPSTSADRCHELRDRHPSEPPHEGVSGDDEFVQRERRSKSGEGVGRVRQPYTPAVDDADGSGACTMADRPADPERLVRPDRRHVEAWVALESTGQGDAEQHGGSGVAEDLIAAQPRSECPGEFVRCPGLGRASDAVEGPAEVSGIESAARHTHVERAAHTERRPAQSLGKRGLRRHAVHAGTAPARRGRGGPPVWIHVEGGEMCRKGRATRAGAIVGEQA